MLRAGSAKTGCTQVPNNGRTMRNTDKLARVLDAPISCIVRSGVHIDNMKLNDNKYYELKSAVQIDITLMACEMYHYAVVP
jgi:hypothetical protein